MQSGAYALLLAEENGIRRIPIIVGTAEAQSIAIALEKIVPPRPLTHDLFASFSYAFGIVLREVFIYKFDAGVFYSELTFEEGDRKYKFDSRTSDAIAIALRVGCDIYTTNEIMEEVGIVLEEAGDMSQDDFGEEEDEFFDSLEPDDISSEEELHDWLSSLSVEQLNKRLEDAIADENYENAKTYKDELRRREKEE